MGGLVRIALSGNRKLRDLGGYQPREIGSRDRHRLAVAPGIEHDRRILGQRPVGHNGHLVQIATGVVAAVAGARPKTSLHFLYGVLVTAGAVVQFGLRPQGFLRAAMTRNAAPLREPRSLAIVCVTQMLLILRAYMTGAFGH